MNTLRNMCKFISPKCYHKPSKRVILLGLDNSGQTTLLYWIKLKELVTTISTIGFNLESVNIGKHKIDVWDVSVFTDSFHVGKRHYYKSKDAIIYTINSYDKERINETKELLQELGKEEDLKNIPLLIYCTFQDKENAISPIEIIETIKFPELNNRMWYFVGCSVYTNTDGIYQGLKWGQNVLYK